MKVLQHDGLNFVLTNRMPRRLVSRWMAWFSRIEHPLVYAASLRVWRLFSELDLSDAQQQRFASLHQCFTRRLKEGARPVDHAPGVLTSPCDAIFGASGVIREGAVLQVKGMPYRLADLLGDPRQAAALEGSSYVTLRLTSAMYHHFHAPDDGCVTSVTHIAGDRWNVNPPALRRVAGLFCRNERVVIQINHTATGGAVTLVAVAAILVGGIKLLFLKLGSPDRQPMGQRHGCAVSVRRGDELGWFEHGSTILLFAPPGSVFPPGLGEGSRVSAGQALVQLPTGQGDGRPGAV